MDNYMMEMLRDVNDNLLKRSMDEGKLLFVHSEEEAYGHLLRIGAAVRSGAKELDKRFEKLTVGLMDKQEFFEKVNDVYMCAQAIAGAAMKLSVGARQIYERETLWPGARAGVTPMEAMVEDAEER